MRSVVASVSLEDALGACRTEIEQQVEQRMQEILDGYRSGIRVQGVAIKQADPPTAVNDAFKAVSAAQQTAQTYLNEARTAAQQVTRSEEHTSELQSLMRISYAVFCLKTKHYQYIY